MSMLMDAKMIKDAEDKDKTELEKLQDIFKNGPIKIGKK